MGEYMGSCWWALVRTTSPLVHEQVMNVCDVMNRS